MRSTSEWNDGHIPNAQHIPMGYVLDYKDSIPDDIPVVVQCGGATRSQVVISLLNNVGFQNLINLSGGFSAWEHDGLPVETDDEM